MTSLPFDERTGKGALAEIVGLTIDPNRLAEDFLQNLRRFERGEALSHRVI